MKRYLSILAVLSLAACQEPVQPETAPGKVQIEPVITKATEVNFENGDKIGLTIAKVNDTQKYADNAPLTYDGTVFSSDLMWYADAYSEADVLLAVPSGQCSQQYRCQNLLHRFCKGCHCRSFAQPRL